MIAIKGHVAKDDLCLKALLKVVLASSKAGDGGSLGVPNLAQHLLLLNLLHFKFLNTFLVSGLSVLGAGLLDISGSRTGFIEFDNGNSARKEHGPIAKTISTFLFAVSIPCLTIMVTGSSLKLMVT